VTLPKKRDQKAANKSESQLSLSNSLRPLSRMDLRYNSLLSRKFLKDEKENQLIFSILTDKTTNQVCSDEIVNTHSEPGGKEARDQYQCPVDIPVV